jgi:hypothetical protein
MHLPFADCCLTRDRLWIDIHGADAAGLVSTRFDDDSEPHEVQSGASALRDDVNTIMSVRACYRDNDYRCSSLLSRYSPLYLRVYVPSHGLWHIRDMRFSLNERGCFQSRASFIRKALLA